MNPTNPMSMHDLVRSEHAYRTSRLDQRRNERDAIESKATARSSATTRSTATSHSLVTRTHRRVAIAVATVATVLALAAGAALASPPGGAGSQTQTPSHHTVPGGFAPRAV